MGEDPDSGQVKSLLPRILQCNRIQIIHKETKWCQQLCCCCKRFRPGRLYFMVMENVFWNHLQEEVQRLTARASNRLDSLASMQSDISTESHADKMMQRAQTGLETYDLKGSTVNRSTAPGSKGTEKDNDLRETLFMPGQGQSGAKTVFMKQISSDTKFLEQHNIMDYSLLLGIQKGRTMINTFAPEMNKTGMLPAAAADSAQSYYFALIDVLQEWDSTKVAERIAKALQGQDLAEISCIEPKRYRERFLSRLEHRIQDVDIPDVLRTTHNMATFMGNQLKLDHASREKLETVLERDGGVSNASDLLLRLCGDGIDLPELPRAVLPMADQMEPEPEPEVGLDEPEPEY